MEAAYQPAVFDDVDVRIVYKGVENIAVPGWRGVWERVAGLFDTRGDTKSEYAAEIQLLATGESYTALLAKPSCKAWGELKDPREYGIELYRWLFGPPPLQDAIRRAIWRSEQLPSQRTLVSRGVRLRLALDPRSSMLHRLWWEALYDPHRQCEVGLQAPISRLVQTHARLKGPVVDLPLRMLVLTSNPEGLAKFDVAAVDVRLEEKLADEALAEVERSVKVTRMRTPKPRDIQRALEELRPHIIYVLAHAVYDDKGNGQLLLCSETGHVEPVPFEAMAPLLTLDGKHAPHLIFAALPQSARVDFDNSLATMGPALLAAGTAAVVAVHAPLPAESLLHFTTAFMGQIVTGGPVDAAMMMARRAIYSPKQWEWTFPVLYLRQADTVLVPSFYREIRSFVS
jgi:hypothetical protein